MGYGRVNALKVLEKAAGAPITGPDLICATGGYTLTNFPAGSSAAWSASSGLSVSGNVATRQNGYSGTGTITATLTVPNACKTIPVKRTIWVGNPNLIKTIDGVMAGTTPLIAGNVYNLASSSTSPSPNNYSYNNYGGTGDMAIDLYSPNSPATQMYVHSNSTNGFRQVKVTATNACGNYAEDFVFYLQSGMFKAYPNPAKEKLTLEFTIFGIAEGLPERVELYPESSSIPVRSIAIRAASGNQGLIDGNKFDLDVSGLPRGTYYLHATAWGGSKEKVEKLK